MSVFLPNRFIKHYTQLHKVYGNVTIAALYQVCIHLDQTFELIDALHF